MSWSDDIRCLYCDGKLPAYRKIASGQFCSGAHQKAYWKKQELLAVERLSQNRESLAVALPEHPELPAVSSGALKHPSELPVGNKAAVIPSAELLSMPKQAQRTTAATAVEAKSVQSVKHAEASKRTEHIEPALALFDLAQGTLAKAASYPMTADQLLMRRVPLDVMVPESLHVVLPSAASRPDAPLQETSLQDNVPDLTQAAHLALPIKFGCPVTADRLVMRRAPLEVLVPESLDVVLPSASYRPDALLQDQDQLLQEKLPDLTQAELFALPVSFGPPVALLDGGPAISLIAVYPSPADPALPKSGLVPVDGTMSPAPPVSLSAYANLVPEDPAQTRDIWQQAADFWKHAPRDLKLALFAIPVLVGMAFHPRLPKVHVAAPAANIRVQANTNFQQVLAKPLDAVQQNLASRAAVALIEDFRFGMDDWQMHSDLSTPWSFDSNGFVRPGSLALYRPSMHLTDYEMQFVGLIDKKALSFVVRAQDFENYYVVKLHVIKPGRLPLIGVTRYAVIHGKAQHRGDAVVSVMAVPDTIFHVNVTVHDDTFLLSLQGKVADSWTEPALTQGGIGFFSASGEESRIRWLQLTHQYDMLGRLCAFLAPYNVSN